MYYFWRSKCAKIRWLLYVHAYSWWNLKSSVPSLVFRGSHLLSSSSIVVVAKSVQLALIRTNWRRPGYSQSHRVWISWKIQHCPLVRRWTNIHLHQLKLLVLLCRRLHTYPICYLFKNMTFCIKLRRVTNIIIITKCFKPRCRLPIRTFCPT